MNNANSIIPANDMKMCVVGLPQMVLITVATNKPNDIVYNDDWKEDKFVLVYIPYALIIPKVIEVVKKMLMIELVTNNTNIEDIDNPIKDANPKNSPLHVESDKF